MKVKDVKYQHYRSFRILLISENNNTLYDGPANNIPHYLLDRNIIEEHPYEDADEYII